VIAPPTSVPFTVFDTEEPPEPDESRSGESFEERDREEWE
jgi:hypothetical protein